MTQGTYLHLEHDGKLLLVDSEGKGPQIPIKGRINSNGEQGWLFRFPTHTEVDSMGIKWTMKDKFVLDIGESKTTILKGQPEIPWPEKWAWKDDVISDSCVHPAVRESVYRSIHRLVSKVVIQDQNKQVLLAKVKRGHFVGCWTLPGGYLDHNEHPRIGAARETMEELGIHVEINVNNTSIVSQNIFTEEGISFVSFTYLVNINSDKIKFNLKSDEIEEVKWFERNDAIKSASSWFDIQAIQELTE
ncbi:MAG TPA: NUDIX hydrolase [Candidatus Poseidoniaceae archaeon]|jgi:ADP-ribose pyrophosphatase YjhB (NUDIX family)|nr:NUDIX hydrolase [Candidatus Poseidoniaceae archaeon]